MKVLTGWEIIQLPGKYREGPGRRFRDSIQVMSGKFVNYMINTASHVTNITTIKGKSFDDESLFRYNALF
jgi:hypothetical protein